MKAIITRQEVAAAIDSLQSAGKKPTLQAIHAAIGAKGSFSTIQKLRAEIEADAATGQDSNEALQVFRQLWAKAVEEGKALKEAECAELREALAAVERENERAAGELIAADLRRTELEHQCNKLIGDLAQANEQVTAAYLAGKQTANKLSAALEHIENLQTRHAAVETDLRHEVTKAEASAHENGIALARTEAKLTAADARVADLDHQREALESELNKAKEEIGALRAANSQATDKLSASMERITQIQTAHATELLDVRSQLTAAERKANELALQLAEARPTPKTPSKSTSRS
jgi:chromosome segregation ATPase